MGEKRVVLQGSHERQDARGVGALDLPLSSERCHVPYIDRSVLLLGQTYCWIAARDRIRCMGEAEVLFWTGEGQHTKKRCVEALGYLPCGARY